MAQLSIIPEFFKNRYEKYLTLKTDDGKKKFWDEVINDDSVPAEVLGKHIKEGLLLLSSQVESLSQRVHKTKSLPVT